MHRRKYDLRELIGIGGKGEASDGSDELHQPPVMDLTAPVLTLGQYPIPKENGLPRGSISIIKGQTAGICGAIDRKVKFGDGLNHAHEGDSAGEEGHESGENSDDGNRSGEEQHEAPGTVAKDPLPRDNLNEGLQLIMDVRAQSDLAYYARRIPGLVSKIINN